MFVHLSLPDAPLLSKTPNFAACKMPLLRLEISSGSCPLSQLIWEPTVTLFSGFPHPPCWSHCAEMAAPHCLQPRPVSRVRVWDLHLTPSTPPPRMSLGNSKSNTFALSASCPLLPLRIIDSHLAPGTEPGAGSFLLTLQACCLTTWPGLCRGLPPRHTVARLTCTHLLLTQVLHAIGCITGKAQQLPGAEGGGCSVLSSKCRISLQDPALSQEI